MRAQKMKFSSKDFLSKCDQIRSFLWWTNTFTDEILTAKFHFLLSDFFFAFLIYKAWSEVDLGLLQHNYYHKALHLGCCSSPGSVSE